MGEHNEIKYTPYGRLGRDLGVSETESGITRLSESLTPIVNIYGQPELALHRGERIYQVGQVSLTAPAARFAIAQLLNPAGSRVIAVVDRLLWTSTVNVNVDAETGDSSAAIANPIVTQAAPIDVRVIPIGASSTCVLRTGDVAAGLVAFPQFFNGNFQTWTEVAFVLAPNSQLLVIASVANTAITTFVIRWRERNANPGELQPG